MQKGNTYLVLSFWHVVGGAGVGGEVAVRAARARAVLVTRLWSISSSHSPSRAWRGPFGSLGPWGQRHMCWKLQPGPEDWKRKDLRIQTNSKNPNFGSGSGLMPARRQDKVVSEKREKPGRFARRGPRTERHSHTVHSSVDTSNDPPRM